MARELRPDLWRERLDVPCYPLKTAAALSKTRTGNISYWLRGSSDGEPVIPGYTPRFNLSWLQMVEVAFVSAMRRSGLSLQRIRRAKEYLAQAYKVDYPFAQIRLKTDGAHVLKNADASEGGPGVLVVADKRGQLAWELILSEGYRQFDYEKGLALVWYPDGRNRLITMDPRVAFGMPAVKGVPTGVLAGRFTAGEDIRMISDDFGLSVGMVIQALAFEGATSQLWGQQLTLSSSSTNAAVRDSPNVFVSVCLPGV